MVSYLALARALGPQKACGFSWNRVRWRLRDWGLASSLTVKQASELHTHNHKSFTKQILAILILQVSLCVIHLWDKSTNYLSRYPGCSLTWAQWRGSWRRGLSLTASPSSQDWPSPVKNKYRKECTVWFKQPQTLATANTRLIKNSYSRLCL